MLSWSWSGWLARVDKEEVTIMLFGAVTPDTMVPTVEKAVVLAPVARGGAGRTASEEEEDGYNSARRAL